MRMLMTTHERYLHFSSNWDQKTSKRGFEMKSAIPIADLYRKKINTMHTK